LYGILYACWGEGNWAGRFGLSGIMLMPICIPICPICRSEGPGMGIGSLVASPSCSSSGLLSSLISFSSRSTSGSSLLR
jgi:hypothetical protein